MSSEHDEIRQQVVELEDGDESSNAAPDEDCSTANARGSITKTEFKWNEKSVRVLLMLRFQRDEEFNRPSCRKIKLWEQVAKEMQNNGFIVNGHSCDSKYRNLLATYRKNKIKQQTSDESVVISWEFFEFMDEHLGPKFDETSESFEYAIQATPSAVESDYEGRYFLTSATPSKKPRLNSVQYTSVEDERKMSIQEYFFEKLQFDKTCYKDDQRRKNRRIELQERKIKIAEKQLELEIKKVEALTALASAISNLKTIVP